MNLVPYSVRDNNNYFTPLNSSVYLKTDITNTDANIKIGSGETNGTLETIYETPNLNMFNKNTAEWTVRKEGFYNFSCNLNFEADSLTVSLVKNGEIYANLTDALLEHTGQPHSHHTSSFINIYCNLGDTIYYILSGNSSGGDEFDVYSGVPYKTWFNCSILN